MSDNLQTATERAVSERLSEFQQHGKALMPVWVRAPKAGHVEHFSGLSRGKLYDLVNEGRIRSISLREPGRMKGVRLFHLGSILDYVERVAANQTPASN